MLSCLTHYGLWGTVHRLSIIKCFFQAYVLPSKYEKQGLHDEALLSWIFIFHCKAANPPSQTIRLIVMQLGTSNVTN